MNCVPAARLGAGLVARFDFATDLGAARDFFFGVRGERLRVAMIDPRVLLTEWRGGGL